LVGEFSATTNIDFTLEGEESKSDSLTNISLYVNGNTDLSAFTIVLKYDENYLEYRSTSKATTAFEISQDNQNGRVKTIFLSDNGYKLNGKIKLADFKFKTVKNGKTSVSLVVKDSVSNKLKKVSVGDACGCSVTIKGNSVTTKTTTSKSKTASKTTSSKSSSASSSNATKASLTESTVAEDNEEIATEVPEVINETEDDSYTPYFVGAIVALILVLLLVVGYKIGRWANPSKEQEKDNKKF
jgi:ABC-type Na+ efflux pump permease subunit